MSLIEKLHNYDMFTDLELTVVHYINDNANRVIDMSINELVKNTFSSKSTIIRICKKLGFNGYKDFKIQLARSIESIKYVNNQVNYSIPFSYDESSQEIANSIASVYKNTINLINSELDISKLEEIADLLVESDRVFVFGRGDSEITALNFINKCTKIAKFFHLATQYDEEISYAKNAGKKDCCLFITYDRTDYYNECVREIIKNRTKFIVITGCKDSLLIRYCNYKIIIPHQEDTYDRIATFYSQEGFQYILSVIYSLMYKRTIQNKKH